jgi:hypothetical protein
MQICRDFFYFVKAANSFLITPALVHPPKAGAQIVEGDKESASRRLLLPNSNENIRNESQKCKFAHDRFFN